MFSPSAHIESCAQAASSGRYLRSQDGLRGSMPIAKLFRFPINIVNSQASLSASRIPASKSSFCCGTLARHSPARDRSDNHDTRVCPPRLVSPERQRTPDPNQCSGQRNVLNSSRWDFQQWNLSGVDPVHFESSLSDNMSCPVANEAARPQSYRLCAPDSESSASILTSPLAGIRLPDFKVAAACQNNFSHPKTRSLGWHPGSLPIVSRPVS